MGSTTDMDIGLGLPGSLPGLGSPFHTPTAKRVASNLRLDIDGIVSPPFSTPKRRPRGPSLLATSPVPTGSHPGKSSHRRNPSLGDVFARMSAVAAASAAAEAAEAEAIAVAHAAAAVKEEEEKHIASIDDLPIELVQQIHLLADNSALPLVSRYTRSCLTYASKTYVAGYMLHQYRHYGPRHILTIALKRPIVDLDVCEEMVRLWDQERGYVRQRPTPTSSPGSTTVSPPSTPSRPRTSAPALEVTQLPRRVFRPKPRPNEPAIHPLIRWLFAHWDFNLKQQGHYPLSRSVINQNYELVEFLLRRGADPNRKEAFALTAAIEKKDIRMVKLLVEPFGDASSSAASSPALGKRRKYDDRVKILQTHVQHALQHGTPEIVDYFVHEKGATPNLNDIMAMGSSKRRRQS